MNNYTPVIGLEVHVELKTKSKMFCKCSADYFGHEPNTHTCPVCLGLPGALPVPNKQAIDWCVMIGMALNCEIQEFSKFDRKNYFYPDLAKGYQISQYDQPFALNGWVEVFSDLQSKEKHKIGITRVHMEEDTGKLLHATIHGEQVSLIDFNRSGLALVEIVTEPDFQNAYEVVQYLQKLQRIVRYLNVSNADMEKGDMRLEPNISLRPKTSKEIPHYKVEVKNINSFKFVEKAIGYELKRQEALLQNGQTPVQETRGWDEKKQITVSQRLKEEANDYRYFPEPDIPPIRMSKTQIGMIQSQLPELQDEKLARFIKEFNLSKYDSEILTREKEMAEFFEKTIANGQQKVTPKQIANFIINKKTDVLKVTPAELIGELLASKKITTIGLIELSTIIEQVFSEQKDAVEDYKKGKTNVLMFLVGQVMRKVGKADPILVKETLLKKLS